MARRRRLDAARPSLVSIRGKCAQVNLDNNALREVLEGFADSEAQLRGWVEGVEFFPSFNELTCMLFDETGLKDAMQGERLEGQYGHDVAARFKSFHVAVHDVDGNVWSREAFESPKVEKVRQLARELLRLIPPDPPVAQ